MKYFVIALATVLLAGTAGAVQNGQEQKNAPSKLTADDWSRRSEEVDVYEKSPIAISTGAKNDRKLATQMSFDESDLKPDMKTFRARMIGGRGQVAGKDIEFPGVKTGQDLATLLNESAVPSTYDGYSDDLKYFLAPLHVSIPLRGIVWRSRKLFEKSGMGNKATHGQAVQLVRTVVTAIKAAFPTPQWDAGVQYFTEPAPGVAQFKDIAELQEFVTEEYIPALKMARKRIMDLYQKDPAALYVWDNTIGYGTGVFDDGLNRYLGHARAEKEIAIASLSAAIHDGYVFAAYNQDHLIAFAGEIGKSFGIDTLPAAIPLGTADFGVTDKERVAVVRKFTGKGWLKMVDGKAKNGKQKFGQIYMTNAYASLQYVADFTNRAFVTLQGGDANNSMAMNPLHYQPISTKNLEPAIKNMKAVVAGETTLRSPITGETVKVDLPSFYLKPLPSLDVLLPTAWDSRGGPESVDANGNRFRNYLSGRSVGWNNEAWSLVVPSAKGQPANYMAKARRVIDSSRGAGGMFGMVDIFVR